jgi:hypothetical protein
LKQPRGRSKALPMPGKANVMLAFPARELSPFERELVRDWLALASDVSDAYVSTRRSDDPALYRRIVVTDAADGRPTHLVHRPGDQNLWVKITVGPYPQITMFGTLREALNSIRNVLVEGE